METAAMASWAASGFVPATLVETGKEANHVTEHR
jgi:hypothetical protein